MESETSVAENPPPPDEGAFGRAVATVAVNVLVSPDLHRALKVHCAANQILIKDFVSEAIREHLKRLSSDGRSDGALS